MSAPAHVRVLLVHGLGRTPRSLARHLRAQGHNVDQVGYFAATQPTAVIRTCMPSDVRKAYARQRELHENGQRGNSQQAFPLITDVMMRGDTVFVVGPLRDQAGRLHVDRYALDGTSLGSVTAFVGSGGFPLDVRFWGDPYDLVAFGPQGTILRVVVEPTP